MNTVKEVLQANLRLRQENLLLQQQLDQFKAEMTHIHAENEELQDKFNVFSSMNEEVESKNDEDDSTLSYMSPPINKFNDSATRLSGSPQRGMDLINELFRVKKDKLLLEKRLKDLERENIHFRAANYNVALADPKEEDSEDFEPVRSVLNSTDYASRMTLPHKIRRKIRPRKYIRHSTRIGCEYKNSGMRSSSIRFSDESSILISN